MGVTGIIPLIRQQPKPDSIARRNCMQGVSWNVAHTAAHLIGSGAVPPFVVVAVDSAGAMRSRNYLPYAPGTGEDLRGAVLHQVASPF